MITQIQAKTIATDFVKATADTQLSNITLTLDIDSNTYNVLGTDSDGDTWNINIDLDTAHVLTEDEELACGAITRP